MKVDYKAAASRLGGWDNILILTHKRPDGDTIGCAVGLCALLRQLGKTAWVLENPDATQLMGSYLKGYVAPADFSYDKVVSVDVASLGLLTPKAREIADSRGIDLALDHHPSNEGFAAANCVEADKAACGELIFKVVEVLGQLTPEIAAPLYLAVSTDTGCFAYNNTSPNVHYVAAALMEQGIDYRAINKRHFRTKSAKRLALESRLMTNLETLEEGKVAISALSMADMAEFHATEEDAEDIAAYLGQIEGVVVSVTIRELREGECKISLRSAPDYLNASETCKKLGGGGHAAASGCTVYGSVPEAWASIKAAVLEELHGA